MVADLDHTEIELKLTVPSASFAKLRRLPAIMEARQGRARTRTLLSTYYDTPDLALSRAGITVRIRSVGRRHVQTVKAERVRALGLFSRGEWEEAIAEPRLDTALLRATELAPLADAALIASLRPVFTTAIRRTTQMLAGPDWQIELALDSGTISAGPEQVAIAEAELELLEGAPAHLFALARAIVHTLPARLATLTKSEQGFDLVTRPKPAPERAGRIRLKPDMPVSAAFQTIARSCLQHFMANERILRITGNGEAIHQMRVALRRLRSALTVFAPLVAGPGLSLIKEDLRWLLAALGPARDADVFLNEIILPALAAHPETPASVDFRDAWIARRDEAMAAALEAVGSRRFSEMLLDIGLWLEAGDWHRPGEQETIASYAASILTKRRAKIRKAGGRHLSTLSGDRLHEVRLLAKRMRYACDFFAALYKKTSVKAHAKTLAGLQDALGALNDIAVAEPRLAEERVNGPDCAWIAGLVAGWHAARRPALLDRAERAWLEVRKAERYWD